MPLHCVVEELSSDSADSVQLRYLGKLRKPGSNLVFSVFAGRYGRKVCERLDFYAENGAVKKRLNTKVIAKVFW